MNWSASRENPNVVARQSRPDGCRNTPGHGVLKVDWLLTGREVPRALWRVGAEGDGPGAYSSLKR